MSGHARLRRRARTAPRSRAPGDAHREGEVHQVGIAHATREGPRRPRLGGAVVVSRPLPRLVRRAIVFAHGIVGRADLPIPETMFGVAAAAVLVLSFAALATLWSRPHLQEYPERRLFPLPAGGRRRARHRRRARLPAHRLRGARGHRRAARQPRADDGLRRLLGRRRRSSSLLVGDVWRLLSPWRAIGRGAGWLAQRFGGEMPEPMRYPARLGRWPAAARAARLRHLRAVLGRGARPAPARGDHARLHRRDARRA